MTYEAGAAVIANFKSELKQYSEAAQKIEGHKSESADKDGHNTRKYRGGGTRKIQEYSGFAHKFEAEIASWQRKYGDAIVGEAIERIAPGFNLKNPKLFYWTTDEEIQEDTKEEFEKFADQMENAMDEIKEILDEPKKRAREQAEQARATEEKYKAMENEPAKTSGGLTKAFRSFTTGLTGKASSIGSAIKGFFKRFGGK